MTIRNKNRQPVVAGIHALPFSKDIGMTERHSGALAILGALEDAGLGGNDAQDAYDVFLTYVLGSAGT